MGVLQIKWIIKAIILFKLLERYCSCPKGFTKHAIPSLGYFINALSSITCILTRGRVFYCPIKTNKEINIH